MEAAGNHQEGLQWTMIKAGWNFFSLSFALSLPSGTSGKLVLLLKLELTL